MRKASVVSVSLSIMVGFTVLGCGGQQREQVTQEDAEKELRTDVESITLSGSILRVSGARLACRRIAIFTSSDHPLLLAIGGQVRDRFSLERRFEEVQFCPARTTSEEGRLAPDLVIALRLIDLKESCETASASEPVECSMGAEIGVTLASTPMADLDFGVPRDPPRPVVAVLYSGSLRCGARTTDKGLFGQRYARVAKKAVAQLAERLRKVLGDGQQAFGLLPRLPEAFYPPYRTPQPTLALREYSPRLLCAYRGLMCHNDTIWQVTTDLTPERFPSDFWDRMKSAGWKEDRVHVSRSPPPAFLGVGRNIADESSAQSPRKPVANGPSAGPTTYYVRYVDFLAKEELTRAIDETLRPGIPADTQILFEDQWTSAQRDRALELLQKCPLKSARPWMTLARLLHRAQRDEEARSALLAAFALRNHGDEYQMMGSSGEGEIQSLATDLGDDKLTEKRPVDRELLERLGFTELKADGESDLALEEPALFYCRDAKGRWKTVSLRVLRDWFADNGPGYRVVEREWLHEGGGSGISTSPPATCVVHWGRSRKAQLTITQVKGHERFHLSVKILPSPPTPAVAPNSPILDPCMKQEGVTRDSSDGP